MNFVFFLLLMVCATSCDPPHIKDSPSLSSKQALANEVRDQTMVQLKMERELYPFGFGSGMMNQIKMLALSFRYYREVEVEQARELLVAAGTLFLNTINNNEQIRPYLDNYPFNPKNIEICIYLRKPDGSRPDPGKLSVVGLVNGILDYDIRSAETDRLTTIYRETFEEAETKLNTVVSR